MNQREFIHPESRREQTQQDECLQEEMPIWGSDSHRLIGEKLRSDSVRPPTLWTPVVCFALLLFMGGTVFGFALSTFASSFHVLSLPQTGGQTAIAPVVGNAPQQVFPVGGSAHLVVHDLAPGMIHVHTSDTNQIAVTQAIPGDAGSTSALSPAPSHQQGNAVTLSIGKQEQGVMLDITLPRDASVEIETDSATINFEGALNPSGTYQFVTQTGSVNLTVPADTAFYLQNIVETGDFTNAFGSDRTGSTPRATLIILAYEGGSVTLQKN
jgi:hypothetical protein